MATSLAILTRNALASAMANLMDQGSLNAGGYFEIRTGAKPSSPQVAATGTLLSTHAASNPAFGSPSNGVVVANAIGDETSAEADGTPGWYRAYNRDGAALWDGTVSIAGGGGDMIVSSASVQNGGKLSVATLSISFSQ